MHGRLAVILFALSSCSSAPTYDYPACESDAGPNPDGCPASFSDARALCTAVVNSCIHPAGRCSYPGAGDTEVENGVTCFATAALDCIGPDDPDAGRSEWRCSQ